MSTGKVQYCDVALNCNKTIFRIPRYFLPLRKLLNECSAQREGKRGGESVCADERESE